MLKQIAWNTFKKTGNIDTFMEMTKLKNLENSLKAENDGNNQDKGNYHIGK